VKRRRAWATLLALAWLMTAGGAAADEFRCAEHRFRMLVPAGWRMRSHPRALANDPLLIAQSPQPQSGVSITVLYQETDSLDEFEQATRQSMPSMNGKLLAMRRLRIHGLEAGRMLWLGTSGGERWGFDSTYVLYRGVTYLITGTAPETDFAACEKIFDEVADSFRPLR
jgi:predicted Zn-dependent protease